MHKHYISRWYIFSTTVARASFYNHWAAVKIQQKLYFQCWRGCEGRGESLCMAARDVRMSRAGPLWKTSKEVSQTLKNRIDVWLSNPNSACSERTEGKKFGVKPTFWAPSVRTANPDNRGPGRCGQMKCNVHPFSGSWFILLKRTFGSWRDGLVWPRKCKGPRKSSQHLHQVTLNYM